MSRLETPDFASPRFKADPYPTYARLRARAPLLKVRLAFYLPPAWALFRYADVRLALKDERFSKDVGARVPWLKRVLGPLAGNLLNQDPPDHTRLRTLVSKAFTPRTVELLRGRIERLCDELLEAAAARGRLELVRDYALPVPITIIAELLGIPPEDRRRFAAWPTALGAATSGAPLDLLRVLPYTWRFVAYCRRLVEERRAQPREDLVSALVQAEEAGDRLSADEVVAMIYLLLVAGYETTVGLIGSGALALLQHPEQLRRWRAEPALAGTGVEELLRYTSPADFASPRIAREGVALGSVVIPRGAPVLAVLGSANRDEAEFPEPDVLRLDREPNRHLALGLGAHFCVGAPLARLEGEIALTALLRRFPDLRLAVAPEALRWRRGLAIRALAELPLRL